MSRTTMSFESRLSPSEFITIGRKILDNYPNGTCVQTQLGYTLRVQYSLTDRFCGKYTVTADIIQDGSLMTINAHCSWYGPVAANYLKAQVGYIAGFIQRSIENKEVLDTYFKSVRCPNCGDNQIQMQKRGWNLLVGLIGSGNNQRVCMKCLHKF